MNSDKKAFVIGWPVNQSKSPALHTYWLNELGLSGSYEKVPVEPDQLGTFLETFHRSGFVGGNITLPHKEAAFDLVDRRDAVAERLGAVNTVWLEGDNRIGSNTDAYGFAANLDAEAPPWRQGENAVIIGAGGASRAIIWAILEAGYSTVQIVNRTHQKAQALAGRFGDRCLAVAWEDAADGIAECDLLVNTTSLTMNTADPFPLALDHLKTSAIVTDIVYSPLETSLLKQARQSGLTCVDGLGMLLHQAVPGFEHWFGQRPTVTAELRTHMLEKISKENTR